jgi:hypothetical protein
MKTTQAALDRYGSFTPEVAQQPTRGGLDNFSSDQSLLEDIDVDEMMNFPISNIATKEFIYLLGPIEALEMDELFA